MCFSFAIYIKTLYFFLTVLVLSAAATVANIKIRYDAKTPQFAIFGTWSYVCSTVVQYTKVVYLFQLFVIKVITSHGRSIQMRKCTPKDVNSS